MEESLEGLELVGQDLDVDIVVSWQIEQVEIIEFPTTGRIPHSIASGTSDLETFKDNFCVIY
jgi:hypothetical protein